MALIFTIEATTFFGYTSVFDVDPKLGYYKLLCSVACRSDLILCSTLKTVAIMSPVIKV
jgi:hypothetical protein